METQTTHKNRLESLFSDLAKLATTPRKGTKSFQAELTALTERLQELEQEVEKVNEAGGYRANGNGNHHDSALYEKENYGYQVSGDKIEQFRETPGFKSPERSLKAPLSASGNIIGQIQLSANENRDWTADETSLANSVAQQAALQIQNLRLLAATDKARTEAETATRQFIHQGWETYLDAINEKERIGYSYDQTSVSPVQDKADVNIKVPVMVMGTEVGAVQLKTNRTLTASEKEMIDSVARQIGQQVENLRLLADASRARHEAEESSRRLAHDNWKDYSENLDDSSKTFVYDKIEVKSVREDELPHNITFSQPLTIQGEVIGQLAISGMDKVSPEAASLAKTIATQASIHLETLRLNEELRRRAAELQELDRLKSAFLANMSHELRTPLNSILGFADVMLEELDGPLTPNMDNDLKLIQKNGQHLLHLINDVLDMAKIESGKLNLIIENFNIHEIMEDVTHITSSLAAERALALIIDEDSDHDLHVNADRTRLKQVLINLVNNAMKFTERGSVTLHAAIQEEDKVLIKIIDTGLGIPPEQLEAVFLEFTQVDSSTTRKVGGTGLGLPISRRLINMHGGKLWAESTGIEGEGSTFYILLPIEAKEIESEPVTKR